ncbi:Uncharacterised protein [uncultured archaeon]|nr:Uncharacterised protein [uncultured archaeon]
MNNAPDGIQTQNNGVIKNAWMKIADVMPSIIENDSLYTTSQGNIQSFYNYDVQLPSNTAFGDCRTEYHLESESASLSIYLNNVLIGNNRLSSFTTSEEGNLTFTANLNIQIKYRIDHFQTDCGYYSSDYKIDTISITDFLNARRYPLEAFYNFTTLNKYSNSTKGLITIGNCSSFRLSFNDSYYKINNYVYDYNYSLKPYNIVTLRAIPQEFKGSSNININPIDNSSFEFIVKNKENCTISISTHFETNNYSCFLEITLKNISIKTDRVHYFANDTVNVNVEPKNLPVRLIYANQTYFVNDSISFLADLDYSRVSAYYGDEFDEKVISVTESSHLVTASKLVLIFLINYLVFSFLTGEAWFFKWLTVQY